MKIAGMATAVSSKAMLILASFGRLLKITAPIAPAFVALATFSENVISPRFIKANLPVKSLSSKSSGFPKFAYT